MSLRSSVRKDPVIILGIFCGVTPFYDFKENKLIHKNVCKVYGLLLASPITAMTIFSGYPFQKGAEIPHSLLIHLEYLMALVAAIRFFVTILGSLFWNMESWGQMLSILSYKRDPKIHSSYHLNVPLIFLIVRTVHEFIIIAVTLYFFEVGFSWRIIFILYSQFVRALTICIIYNTTGAIRNRYKLIYNVFEGIRLSAVIKRTTVTKIQEMQRIYVETDKIIDIFNEIFGWPILLTLAELVVAVVHSLALITENGYNFSVPYEMVALNTYYAILSLIGPLLLIFASDKAVKEGTDLLKKCCYLLENLPMLSREKEEMGKLINLMENKPPKFTAADFFEIKRSTLLSLINTTTTYMIVVLQFNYF